MGSFSKWAHVPVKKHSGSAGRAWRWIMLYTYENNVPSTQEVIALLYNYWTGRSFWYKLLCSSTLRNHTKACTCAIANNPPTGITHGKPCPNAPTDPEFHRNSGSLFFFFLAERFAAMGKKEILKVKTNKLLTWSYRKLICFNPISTKHNQDHNNILH